jgi:response regulator of citrate/malate metabolism
MSEDVNLSLKKKCHLLVVEDDIDVSFIMKRRLTGFFPEGRIELVKTLLDAQKYLYKNNVDLIFLDLNLPDNMGASSVKDVKPYAKGTPIIVTTGLASELTIEEVMKAGATELVLKTDIDKEYLEKTFAKYLSQKEEATEAEVQEEAEGTEVSEEEEKAEDE